MGDCQLSNLERTPISAGLWTTPHSTPRFLYAPLYGQIYTADVLCRLKPRGIAAGLQAASERKGAAILP
jgi:hypothetical protein